jgi:Leucine-rich repeat (LRR) protein
MSAGHVSRPWRRYLRFGVLGLLILVLVLGFWLAWDFHLAHVQREAIAGIEDHGGTVLYDWQWNDGHAVPAGQPWAPPWLVARIRVDCFGHVTFLKLRSSLNPNLDSSNAKIERLTGLQALHLNSGQPIGPQPLSLMVRIADAQLGHLKGLTRLSELELRGILFKDAELVHLKGLTKLSTLSLAGTPVGNNGLPLLEGLTNLSSLDLSCTQVSDAGLESLKELTKLSALDLTGTRITDAGLRTLKCQTNLSTLDLTGTRVTDAGLQSLKGLTNLSTLNVSYTPISDAGLRTLRELTNLSTLDLSTTRVSNAGAKELSRALPGLKLVR